MDFFEVLAGRAEAQKVRRIFHGYEHDTWASGKGFGINATIEALKEMMVGETIEGRSSHHITLPGEPWTSIWLHGTQERITISGHCGTDGGKVAVIVFSLS